LTLPLPSITATIKEWLSRPQARVEAEVLGRRVGKLDNEDLESQETLVEGLTWDFLGL